MSSGQASLLMKSRSSSRAGQAVMKMKINVVWNVLLKGPCRPGRAAR